jgi:calcineurin-like phosphoesterase family protein
LTTHFTADLHFNHKAVIKKMARHGFNSIDEHDEYVISSINKNVKVNDTLYILGDMCNLDYRRHINCRNVILILGNHDPKQITKEVKNTFTNVDKQLTVNIDGYVFYLSHYPHAYWDRSHYGSYHLYGHCHTKREGTLDNLFQGRRSMDVGVDNAKKLLDDYRPFTMTEVLKLLESRAGHDPVSHYRDIVL